MKLSSIILSFCCAALLLSCGDKAQKKEPNTHKALDYIRPASMVYSHNDTAEIRSLIQEYIENFKQRDFAACADMLYTVEKGEVIPLSADEKKKYVKGMSSLPVYDMRESSFVLQSDVNNRVELTVQIIQNGDMYKKIGTTSQFLNPVYKENRWFLTLLDQYAEGVKDEYAVER